MFKGKKKDLTIMRAARIEHSSWKGKTKGIMVSERMYRRERLNGSGKGFESWEAGHIT